MGVTHKSEPMTNQKRRWLLSVGFGVGLLAILGVCAVAGQSARLKSNQADHQMKNDDQHVMVDPIKSLLSPENTGIPRHISKLLPYRIRLNVNGQSLTFNFTAYRPPHRYSENFFHFNLLEAAQHQSGKGFDNARLVACDAEQVSFQISSTLNDLWRIQRLDHRSAPISSSKCQPGQLSQPATKTTTSSGHLGSSISPAW